MLELRRFKDLSVFEHSRPWHDLVARNSTLLEYRYMGGVALKYGMDEGDSIRNFNQAISQDYTADPMEGVTRFAVIEVDEGELATGTLVGALTLFRGLPLRAMRLHAQPRLARGPLTPLLSRNYPLQRGTNVSGWVDVSAQEHRVLLDAEALADAYGAALSHMNEGELPWTVEPTHPLTSYARTALELARYRRRGESQHYDVGENSHELPPASLLYVHSPIGEAA